jgi:hypothetical protein
VTDLSEEHLAELIAALPPPPPGWLKSAIELPRARAAIEELTTRATDDGPARHEMLADLEAALLAAGVEPRPDLLEQLRIALSRLDE